MIYNTNYLAHHGVLGMKWGVRRYQKKDGTRTALGKRREQNKNLTKRSDDSTKNKKKGLTDRQKKYIKIGAVAAGAALVTVGGLYLYKSGRVTGLADKGKKFLDKFKPNRLIGKYHNNDPSPNCAHYSVAYLLNNLFDKKVTPKPMLGIDEKSGALMAGRDGSIFSAIFDNIKTTGPNGIIDPDNRPKIYDNKGAPIYKNIMFNYGKKTSFSRDIYEHIPDNTKGVLKVYTTQNEGHAVNYVRNRGIIKIFDDKNGLYFSINRFTNSKSKINSFYAALSEVMDFTNATLKENAGDVLKYMVDGFK